MRIYELSPSTSGTNTLSIIEGGIVDAIACLIRRIINTPPAVSLTFSKKSIMLNAFDPQADTEDQGPLSLIRPERCSQDQRFFALFSAELFQLMQEVTVPTKGPLIFLRDNLTSAHVRFAIAETIEKLRLAEEPHRFCDVILARIRYKIPPSRRTVSGTLLRIPSTPSPVSENEAVTVRTFQATA